MKYCRYSIVPFFLLVIACPCKDQEPSLSGATTTVTLIVHSFHSGMTGEEVNRWPTVGLQPPNEVRIEVRENDPTYLWSQQNQTSEVSDAALETAVVMFLVEKKENVTFHVYAEDNTEPQLLSAIFIVARNAKKESRGLVLERRTLMIDDMVI